MSRRIPGQGDSKHLVSALRAGIENRNRNLGLGLSRRECDGSRGGPRVIRTGNRVLTAERGRGVVERGCVAGKAGPEDVDFDVALGFIHIHVRVADVVGFGDAPGRYFVHVHFNFGGLAGLAAVPIRSAPLAPVPSETIAKSMGVLLFE